MGTLGPKDVWDPLSVPRTGLICGKEISNLLSQWAPVCLPLPGFSRPRDQREVGPHPGCDPRFPSEGSGDVREAWPTPPCKRDLKKALGGRSVAKSCPTLCNPMVYTAHGILQARILEWVRSEEHTSELQSQTSISYAVFCLKKIFFNDTATTEIYTLSLHDALPI